MSKNRWSCACAPFVSEELLGVDEDKRGVVHCACNNKCEHWKACWDELGYPPPEREFKKFPATTRDVSIGAAVIDKQGRIWTWKLVKRK